MFAFLGGLILASCLVGIILWNVLSNKKRQQQEEQNRHVREKNEDPEEITSRIEVSPIDDEDAGRDYVVEEESKKRQERADFIFDMVNLSTAMLTIIITILFLNTFTSLWLRGYIHGHGYVRLGYGLGEETRSLLSTSSPIINVKMNSITLIHIPFVHVQFYNAKMSDANQIEYKHGWRKFCATPLISESYYGRKRNYTGYWGRCMIDSDSDCTSTLKHE